MAVIAHLRIPAQSFELGRILEVSEKGTVKLESMVPLGQKAVAFFSMSGNAHKSFEQTVGDHPSVEQILEITSHENERLYSLDWDVARDMFFQGIAATNGQLLSGSEAANMWEFEVRFPTHEALSEFRDYCETAEIPLEVGHIYNPVRPDAGIWYGVTSPQRETLIRAVEGGYYSIPRQMSTQELAGEFGISDQAVTERLRRAIITLTKNTLIAMQAEQDGEVDEAS